MKAQAPHCEMAGTLEIELLLTEDQRRTDRETDELIEELRAAAYEEEGAGI